jgi:CRISPR-associated endonuclease Csn1
LYFGFGINTLGDRKKILFYTGGETANVRKNLNLDKLLYSSEEEFKKAKESGLKDKNRENKKHHALDALVLNVLPEIKTKVRSIEQKPDYFNAEFCKEQLNKVIPEIIKQKTP